MSGINANPIAAAMMVHDGLKAAPADQGGNVIVVTLKQRNPAIVQPLLHEIIDDYFQRHFQIHSSSGMSDDALTREQAALSVQLNATEQQLADLKNQAGIISLEDARKNLSEQVTKVQTDLLNAQAELAGYQSIAVGPDDHNVTPKLTATNAAQVIPPEQMDAYNGFVSRLEALRKKEQNYLIQGFTSSNLLVLEIKSQITNAEGARADLEAKYPQITGVLSASIGTPGSVVSPVADARAQAALINALQSKIKALTGQLAELRLQTTNLNNLAPQIAQLEQTRAIQQANLQNLSTSLMKFRIDESLDTGKTPNLKWVQLPSPPGQDWTKTHKKMGMMVFAGILAGLAWAFLIELFWDRSVKRAGEVEARLKIPLFLSIPDVNRNGRAHRLKRQLALPGRTNGKAASPQSDDLDLVSLEKNPALEPYLEALRDRLIMDFEARGLTHKPKMVAVTSAGLGAGVSTLATGLAASLSNTGDGHVLLVDMNLDHGAAQRFHQGKILCDLDTALEKGTKENAMVQENLYMVTENSSDGNLQRVLPRRFASLLPKFEAAEFDYIIFDLPPVSQTSVTTRVARFMDTMLLVIESEETDRELVSRANKQLTETGATVSAVLNKTRKYIPDRIRNDSNSAV
jgi:Mrp family chromosome partitioning ATPase/uncharacterized protein involved in exopolysaccharide biosynthesis